MTDWISNLSNVIMDPETRVFTRQGLTRLLTDKGRDFKIPRSVTTAQFIDVMKHEGLLSEIELRREGSRTSRGAILRYTWGEASPYQIALSLRGGSYLSHSTAVFLHALTDQVPKTIYANKEQSSKPRSRTGLSQPAIDRAFKSSPRVSKHIFSSGSYRYVLLSGKQTEQLGVTVIHTAEGSAIRVAGLERTMIDIVVRPSYAGGAYELLRAYHSARDRVDFSELLATLEKLGYVYPYHQSIGFLMERAGYPATYLKKLQSMGIRWNFYLDYKLQDPAFDDKWQLFYPKGF